MQLSLRMTAATTLAGLLVFGAYGALLIAGERHDLRASTEREISFLGASLRVGIENALRDRQLADVEEATLRLEGIDTQIDVFVYDQRGTPVVAPTGVPDGGEAAALSELVAAVGAEGQGARRDAGTGGQRLRYHPEVTPTVLLLATPLLTDAGEPVGVLAISRPLDDINQDLTETAGYIAATVGIFLLLAIGLGLYVGESRLSGPLTRLTASMRSIRRGEALAPLEEQGDDELVEAAREFNRMLAELQQARAAAAAEADQRRELARSLEAADRMITVGQLAAAVAHEIGSPLQVLLGRARALGDRAEDVERVRRSAPILVREAERITRIVEQLLTITSCPRQLAAPPPQERVDLHQLAAQVLWLLEVEAKRSGATLRLEGAAVARCVPDQMRQVVLNLARNALASVEAGGEVRVVVGTATDQSWIEVIDDGAGISPEIADCIFEPLFTTRADHGGTGLGLPIVRSIITAHRGQVAVRSSPGAGATFRVSWPVEEG